MKSFLGWLLLLVALAVPAVIFHNWWTQMQQAPSSLDAGQQMPAGANAFGEVRSAGGPPAANAAAAAPAAPGGEAPAPRSAAPGAGSPPPGEGAAAAAAPAAQPGGAGVPTAATTAASAPGEQRPSSAPGADPVARPAGEAAGQGAKPAGRAAIEYKPNTDRDPTLSVLDLKLLALERERRLEAMRPPPPKKEPRAAPPPVKKEDPVWTKIEVQGIIGSDAIINDERRRKGDSVFGCVISKITTSTVIFRCKDGKSFYKKIGD